MKPSILLIGLLAQALVSSNAAAQAGEPAWVPQARSVAMAVPPCGDELDLAVEQFLLGIQNVENGAVSNAVLGAGAFEREFVCRHRAFGRGDHIL